MLFRQVSEQPNELFRFLFAQHFQHIRILILDLSSDLHHSLLAKCGRKNVDLAVITLGNLAMDQTISKYLQQLCKHFSHKLEVAFTEASGNIHLPTGPAELIASSDTLLVSVSVEDELEMDRAKRIIDNHLVKFAFRENFEGFEWLTKAKD